MEKGRLALLEQQRKEQPAGGPGAGARAAAGAGEATGEAVRAGEAAQGRGAARVDKT